MGGLAEVVATLSARTSSLRTIFFMLTHEEDWDRTPSGFLPDK
jgi:hypothetical protein